MTPRLTLLLLLTAASWLPSVVSAEEPAPLAEELRAIREELAGLRAEQDKRLRELEDRLRRLEPQGAAAAATKARPAGPAAPTAPAPTAPAPTGTAPAAPAPAPSNGTPASVCRKGCAFSDLQAAIKAAKAGDVITVAPGLYGFCAVVEKSVTLRGLKSASGARAHLAGAPCWGKGSLVLRGPDIVVEGFEISNVSVPSKNGACLRIDSDAGNITIRDLYCHDSENGILGGPLHGEVLVEDSLFERNGGNSGSAHGIYIDRGNRFLLRRSLILATKGQGHSLKSGAETTVVEDSVIAALDGLNSRAIDAFGGGRLEVRRSVLQQGPNSENHEVIGIALEPARINPELHSTLVEDSWILFDSPERCCRWLFTAKVFGPIVARGNRIVGMTAVSGSPLIAEVADNRLFAERAEAGLPPYDGTEASLPLPDRHD